MTKAAALTTSPASLRRPPGAAALAPPAGCLRSQTSRSTHRQGLWTRSARPRNPEPCGSAPPAPSSATVTWTWSPSRIRRIDADRCLGMPRDVGEPLRAHVVHRLGHLLRHVLDVHLDRNGERGRRSQIGERPRETGGTQRHRMQPTGQVAQVRGDLPGLVASHVEEALLRARVRVRRPATPPPAPAGHPDPGSAPPPVDGAPRARPTRSAAERRGPGLPAAPRRPVAERWPRSGLPLSPPPPPAEDLRGPPGRAR